MKNALIKWLGLNSLASTLTALRKENEDLKKSIADLEVVVADLETKVNDIETPDMDDYVQESDLDEKIENFLSDNDYCTWSYIEGEIGDKVEGFIDDYGIEDKVEGFVISEMQKTHPVLMTEETLRKEISEAVKVTLEKVVKAMSEA